MYVTGSPVLRLGTGSAAVFDVAVADTEGLGAMPCPLKPKILFYVQIL